MRGLRGAFWLYYSINLLRAALGISEVGNAHGLRAAVKIVFIYLLVPKVCKHGLPPYIHTVLNHTLVFQKHAHVAFVSNFADCTGVSDSLNDLVSRGLLTFDSSVIQSPRTRRFHNVSREVFPWDNHNELWMTSALRFFVLEDLLRVQGWDEVLHVEADNLLFAQIDRLAPILREHYPMAATPLSAGESYITASVLWVSHLKHLMGLNDYLLHLAEGKVALEAAQQRLAAAKEEADPPGYPFDSNVWREYTTWLRRYACCKVGGVAPDEDNRGIKPYAINEMTMLAYYHVHHAQTLRLLPIIPPAPPVAPLSAHPRRYPQKRHFGDLNDYTPNGRRTGPATLQGIWDPNSWGQYLGGTSKKRGRDRGFVDTQHLGGQAVLLGQCRPYLACDTTLQQTSAAAASDHNSYKATIEHGTRKTDYAGLSSDDTCYVVPFVSCALFSSSTNGTSSATEPPAFRTPLFNLHVHSKDSAAYVPLVCACDS